MFKHVDGDVGESSVATTSTGPRAAVQLESVKEQLELVLAGGSMMCSATAWLLRLAMRGEHAIDCANPGMGCTCGLKKAEKFFRAVQILAGDVDLYGDRVRQAFEAAPFRREPNPDDHPREHR